MPSGQRTHIGFCTASRAVSRARIASAPDVKPYSGRFNRTLVELLNSKKIVYCPQASPGRTHLLRLAEN